MSNEIKEILDIFYNEYPKEEKQLEDFITNLQEENKRYSLDRVELEKRISKAVDYIISTYHDEPTELYGLVCADELLDILRGDE